MRLWETTGRVLKFNDGDDIRHRLSGAIHYRAANRDRLLVDVVCQHREAKGLAAIRCDRYHDLQVLVTHGQELRRHIRCHGQDNKNNAGYSDPDRNWPGIVRIPACESHVDMKIVLFWSGHDAYII